ncbi:MAG: hypothetical protein K9K75_04290 [Deltaproteobacteria bacterium]|nr:hypothetical protein [Deltaproteobacteria bacterium]
MDHFHNQEDLLGDNISWVFIAMSSITLLLLACFLLVCVFLQLDGVHKELLREIFLSHSGYIIAAALLVVAFIVSIIAGIMRNYVIPIKRLTEETTIISTNNPAHRVRLEGGRDVKTLAGIINDSAQKIEELHTAVEKRIAAAREEIETEKNIILAIMAELLDGVIVCNAEAQILLYNQKARVLLQEEFLDDVTTSSGGKNFAGLGRSIFTILDKATVTHGLDDIAEKIARGEYPVSRLLLTGVKENTIRADILPILNDNRDFKGFVLMLYDSTEDSSPTEKSDFLLQNITTSLKRPISNIALAAEALIQSSVVEAKQARKFKEIIAKEASFANKTLEEVSSEYAKITRAKYPLAQLTNKSFFETLAKAAKEKIGVVLTFMEEEDVNWLNIDIRSFTLSLLYLMRKVTDETGQRQMSCRTRNKGHFTTLDITWHGAPIKIEMLRSWEEQNLVVGKEGLPTILKDVLDLHGAKVWPYIYEVTRERAGIRIFLPDITLPAMGAIRRFFLSRDSRPEYYDFNLFDIKNNGLLNDDMLLSDLSYTVFDTETTGLSPDDDEIISIGAVRIVNGKLLKNEFFDTLINPKRTLPPESTIIHGVQTEMLAGKPYIEEVLPTFYRFSEKTVLVAHNAAFDMKMLQMKEEKTGTRFRNPVLDTLLLSAVVHPNQEKHNLETIAARFGISVVGRHTALGDALMTGEIFLKLLPLLEKKGIRTLQAAMEASKNTLFAKITY